MSVVSSPRRQKSWQIADKVASLLDTVNIDREQFTAKLRALSRAHPDVTSDEDAARLVGVSYRQYQRWLSGESEPRGSSLKLIAEKFGVPVSELLGQPDRSQLDRIEAMLARLLKEQGLSPAEEDGQAAAVVADVDARLVEAAGSRPRKAPARPQSRPAATRHKRA